MSGRIVVIHPEGKITIIPWRKSGMPDVHILQKEVGGYVERIRVRYEGKVRWAYVNENGLLLHLPVNLGIMKILAEPYSSCYIVGPAAVWVPDARPRKGL